jgi:general secretion pathway protein D
MLKIIPLVILFAITSCGSGAMDDVKARSKFVDSKAELTREEFEDGLIRDKKKEEAKKILAERSQSAIPPMSKLLVVPPPPPMGSGKLISFSVTEDVPLKDVLIELGRVADLDIEVDTAITGGIILKVKDKPLKTVVERICSLGNLRYSFQDGIIKFELDNAYSKNYTVDFLIDGQLWSSIETSMDQILTDAGGDGSITINKPAGVITVFANNVVQKSISEYIEDVRRNASAQVLLEAKIIEVTLEEDYSTGIDWSWVEDNVTSTDSSIKINAGTLSTGGTDGLQITSIGSNVLGGSLTANVSMLQQFGTTRTLSSPRILSMNNQAATLKFVNSIIYFELDIEEEDETNSAGETIGTTVTYNSEQKETEEGVTLKMTPSIDLVRSEITLSVEPTLSVQTGTVEDPAVKLQLEAIEGVEGEDIQNLVPLIQTRTIKTSLKINSGDAMVIGGLMNETIDNQEDGVPFLSRMPALGHLFKKVTEDTKIVETVIFIKATIIDSRENGVDKYDREFHDTYSTRKRRMF